MPERGSIYSTRAQCPRGKDLTGPDRVDSLALGYLYLLHRGMFVLYCFGTGGAWLTDRRLYGVGRSVCKRRERASLREQVTKFSCVQQFIDVDFTTSEIARQYESHVHCMRGDRPIARKHPALDLTPTRRLSSQSSAELGGSWRT
jgi:hypothetical protein